MVFKGFVYGKVAIIIIMVLVLALLVNALKPGSASTGGIVIITPSFDYYPQYQDNKLHFHLFNATNNRPITGAVNATCMLHSYNMSDRHITQSYLTVDGDDWEWTMPQNISNFTVPYSFIIYCNNSQGFYGYLRDSFTITSDGFEKTNGYFLAGLLMILPLLIGFLLIYWSSLMGDDHAVFKLFLHLLSFVTVIISFWFSAMAVIRFTNWTGMVSSIGTVTLVFGILFFAILSYFFIWILYKIFKGLMKNKEEKFDY